jgi:hypothetical protein
MPLGDGCAASEKGPPCVRHSYAYKCNWRYRQQLHSQNSEIFRPMLHVRIVVVDLPEELLARELEAPEIVLSVQAFFPEATFEAFREALHANVGLNNIPNTDFTEKTAKALKLMARDIGLF